MSWWLRAVSQPRKRRAGKGSGFVLSASALVGALEANEKRHPWLWPVVAAVLVTALHLVLFAPVPRATSFGFPVAGGIAEEDIRAPFPFTAQLLPRDVEMVQIEKVLVEPPVLRRVEGPRDQGAASRLSVFGAALRSAAALPATDTKEKVNLLAAQFPYLDDRDLERALATPDMPRLLAAMQRTVTRVMQDGVADMLPPGKYTRVVVAEPTSETLRDLSEVTLQSRLVDLLPAKLRQEGLAPTEAVWAASLLRQFTTPNLIYDPDETRANQERARASVSTTQEFARGERIVSQGERVTEQEAVFLDALRAALTAKGGTASLGVRVLRVVNRTLLLAVLLGLFGWLARSHFPVTLLRLRFLTALTAMLAVFLLAAAFVLDRAGLGIFTVPIAFLALIATVLFKEGAGYGMTLLAVGLLGLVPETGVRELLALSWLGLVTVVAVRRIQKRSQFYQIVSLLSVLSVVLLVLVRWSQGHALLHLGGEFLAAVFTPGLSVALALFVLPLVEPLVGVSSDLTLLELSDLNHPLLQRMALEAPGTYHHSQVVSQLAEQAARAIDANALQVRVGALFHDIGKMQKSEYYVENQRAGSHSNKHDELSPSMSALIIASHVKDGIELARRWRLPQDVIDFIPQHHGTQVMEYFYHKALEGDGNETVKVDDFRYPGPKPQRRETAVLMLADAVEAATRSLPKPTPSRIKEITKQLCDKRMLSGELDECNLTLSDLARIREAFIPLLTGIHHARIAYPGQKEKEAERKPERTADA